VTRFRLLLASLAVLPTALFSACSGADQRFDPFAPPVILGSDLRPPLPPERLPPGSLGRLAQAAGGRRIGAAIASAGLLADPQYAAALAREFTIVTPENALKFEQLGHKPGIYDFRAADQMVAWALALDMEVRGHTLVWDDSLPPWLENGRFSRDELIAILRTHVTTVVGRYKGRIAAWDVVNEAVAPDGSLSETFWLKGIGPEYIEMAFRWAHEADPKALLFYNDYGAEGLGAKSDGVVRLLRDLQARGVPVHGVGLQMHLGTEKRPAAADIAANMARLGGLGLVVHVTEMDVRLPLPASGRDLEAQARAYAEVLEVCLDEPSCRAFVFWGFTDAYSWVPRFIEGHGAAHILDASYRPKPAYNALVAVLSRRQG
jgi:endo-1,4-beta-xylanase